MPYFHRQYKHPNIPSVSYQKESLFLDIVIFTKQQKWVNTKNITDSFKASDKDVVVSCCSFFFLLLSTPYLSWLRLMCHHFSYIVFFFPFFLLLHHLATNFKKHPFRVCFPVMLFLGFYILFHTYLLVPKKKKRTSRRKETTATGYREYVEYKI